MSAPISDLATLSHYSRIIHIVQFVVCCPYRPSTIDPKSILNLLLSEATTTIELPAYTFDKFTLTNNEAENKANLKLISTK